MPWARTSYARRARRGSRRDALIFKHGLRASLAPIVDDVRARHRAPRRRGDHHRIGVQPERPRLHGGRLVFRQDLPATLGVVLVTTFAVVIMNLVVDILYAFLDPRVRYG